LAGCGNDAADGAGVAAAGECLVGDGCGDRDGLSRRDGTVERMLSFKTLEKS
jgi:hypothetical protein